MSQRVALVAVVLTVWSACAGGQQYVPPYSMGPLSVQAGWSFESLADPLPASLPPSQFKAVEGSGGEELHDTSPSLLFGDPSQFTIDQGRLGALGDGEGNASYFIIRLANFIDEWPIKYARIEVDYTPAVDELPIVAVTDGFDPTGPLDVRLVDQGGEGTVHYWDFEIRPNPDWEEFRIDMSPGGYLRQVYLTTQSDVPEPTVAALLVAGGVALLRRRGWSGRRH